MIDFTPVREARLGPSDLSKIVGVSRVTCSSWLNGHAQPHHLLTDKVRSVVDAVARAVEVGSLPVPYHVLRRQRAHHIATALEKVSQATAD